MSYTRYNDIKISGEIVAREDFKFSLDMRYKIFSTIIFGLKITDDVIVPCMAINELADQILQGHINHVFISGKFITIDEKILVKVNKLTPLH